MTDVAAMFEPFSADEWTLADAATGKANDAKTPILPVPEDAPLLSYKHPKWGYPTEKYAYHDTEDRLLAHVARFDMGDGGKTYRPLTFCALSDGTRLWCPVSLPVPRPLYRLPELVARPDAPVLVTEGEKAADAAARLFPDHVATTPMHGAKSPHTADWSYLAGRIVTVWRDNDDAGAAFAERVAELVMAARAASVSIVQVPADFPEKWDLADEAPAGADLRALLSNAGKVPDRAERGLEDTKQPERPYYATYVEQTKYGPPGLYYHGWGKSKKDEPPPEIDTWICGPIWADARTEDASGRSHGLLLRFLDPDGREKRWAAPLSFLGGDGAVLREVLLDQGLRIDPHAGRNLLPRWLMSRYPARKTVAATQCGWLPDCSSYILPSETIGPADAVWQGDTAPAVSTSGTLDGWRDAIAAPASGNPLAVLALSAALAAPLLALVRPMGMGLHFVGDSSTGKTTLLALASSVWGRPDAFMRTWRATSNGLEAIAAAHNDGLLVLDEISECNPNEIGSIVYALANGTGKTRAARTGGTRPVFRWRIVLISSGERSVAASMAEGGRTQKAGQSVRVLDIPCHRAHGVFDSLGDLPDGRTMSDTLKKASGTHYGHAGPAFVRALLSDTQDFGKRLAEAMDAPEFAASGGLDGRAAATLALIGMAGELARDHGIVPWGEGEAFDAAALALDLWRNGRETHRPEDHQILDTVRDFLLAHGDSRFSALGGEDDGTGVRDRAGWWKNADGNRVYLLTSAAMREAAKGFDLKRALDALDQAGWIAERDQGKRSKKTRVPGRTVNLYAIAPVEAGNAAR